MTSDPRTDRTVSVIVPARAAEPAPPCLDQLPRLRYPAEKVEVLLAVGDNASVQRNVAAGEAQGDILYFIDDDCRVDRDALLRMNDVYQDHPDAAGVGGPSLGRRDDGPLQRSISVAMGSVFGLGPVRHRYYPSGLIRNAGDNELILCNLSMRKEAWRRHRGFDPRLYPNEENEFINRVQKDGTRFRYHPLMTVSRSPRPNLRALALQCFRYGAGRIAHYRIRPDFINLVLLAPMLFVAYLAWIAALAVGEFWAYGGPGFLLAEWWRPTWWFLLPLAIYLNLLGAAALFAALSSGGVRGFLHLLAIYPTIHCAYGLGMFVGRLRRFPALERRPSVRLYRLKPLGVPFPAEGRLLAGAAPIDVSEAIGRMITRAAASAPTPGARPREKSNAAGVRGG